MSAADDKTCFICCTCGTQFAESTKPPGSCAICQDSRQYVPRSGQTWTTLIDLARSHSNSFSEEETNLLAIETTPAFAIGQRALLLRTPAGNILWDCISLIDAATIDVIDALGGLIAIAISHPHYYTTMVAWSRAFGGAPIYLHRDDREWVMRPDGAIKFWEGENHTIAPGINLLHCGGHFPGGTVLHWADGAEGKGVLLSGDILQVTPDGWVSFMFSYPNYIPLPGAAVSQIAQRLKPWKYDRIYGAFAKRSVEKGAAQTVEKSVQRYLAAIAPARDTRRPESSTPST